MLFSLRYSASQLKTIHLLRACLRETTYLPDAAARQYFRRYVLHRFKAYQPARNGTASIDTAAVERYKHRSFKRRKESVIRERTRATQQKAQKGLNYLRRANQGANSCLQKVLLFTYGRMGRRRYTLLSGLLEPEPVSPGPEGLIEPAAAPPLQQLYHSNARFLSFFTAPRSHGQDMVKMEISPEYPRLRTVLKTQVAAGVSIGRAIKSDQLTTPVNNIWDRPMPIKRARNNVRRWYAMAMDKLLPPLPEKEFDRLRGLATGEIKWRDGVKPRNPAVELNTVLVTSEDRTHALIEDALFLPKPSLADRPAGRGKSRPSTINRRFMKRMYMSIYILSCKLVWSEERSRWNAEWGSRKHAGPLQPYTSPVDASLFSGVDHRGKVPQGRVSP
ncbi:hypothetical protein P154DRAFT_272260 [Amniculicola lignicola CBS 123094]|uniref:LYR motif-containing protein Cup1-like N-terminal domain-containing protein n=1 Tax=Amniculicola lignicola CBS 123094 TaxID=1392246 RepID=A0A6A5W784_9PLEO|nr:hypothetical protein P154DRAFT_272260 [Amniculicola lignicola CBS 123094]